MDGGDYMGMVVQYRKMDGGDYIETVEQTVG
jgi:hypothetical protein